MSDVIIIPKSAILMVATIFVAAILGSYAGTSLAGFSGFGSTTGNVFTPSPTATAAPAVGEQNAPSPSGGATLASLAEGGHSLGSSDAPIVIIEFSDFQCPFCQRFDSATKDQIVQNYVDTGRVQFVYKHFPLSFHPEANNAAHAAECAGEQGKFWEYHDQIFDNQQALSSGIYSTWAQQLGLNVEQFNSCMSSGKYQDKINADFQLGQAAGVSGTPSFLIGLRNGPGQRVVGAQPFQVFSQAIDNLA